MIDEQLGMFPVQESNSNPKELFDSENIEVKTELTGEQVLIISKLKAISSIIYSKYKIDILERFVNNFLELQVSKDRASRKEFVSAFQSKNDERTGGLMDKMSMNLGGGK